MPRHAWGVAAAAVVLALLAGCGGGGSVVDLAFFSVRQLEKGS